MVENYVRKYYDLRDSWSFKSVVNGNVNGVIMPIYTFEHVGRKVLQDKVIDRG